MVVSVLLFLILLCCLFGCFGHTIKEKYVKYQERKKREVVTTGITPEAFDAIAEEFQAIFTE